MPKFRTVIPHKAGSSIEVNGLTIELNPDETGFCEFDVPDARDDVFARLKEIPEGFLEIANTAEDVIDDVPGDLIVTVDGEKVDLATLDRANLVALAKHVGLTPHHKSSEATIRNTIVEKLAE